MVKLYVRDNQSGEVHEYGTNPHDALIVDGDGALHYLNLQNSAGTEFQDEGYTFVLKNGQDPRESKLVKKYGEAPIIDIGGTYSPIEKVEVVRDTSWLKKVADEVAPSRGERVFDRKE